MLGRGCVLVSAAWAKSVRRAADDEVRVGPMWDGLGDEWGCM